MSETFDCTMCGAQNAFTVDLDDPAKGYCSAEDTVWTVRATPAFHSLRFDGHVKSCHECSEPFSYCAEGSRLLRASVDAGNI